MRHARDRAAAAGGKASSTSTRTAIESRTRTSLERIRALAIPPGWEDVWICSDPLGHIQATGVDARGRKQYRYHDLWRERRDREKFDSMTEFGRALPSSASA